MPVIASGEHQNRDRWTLQVRVMFEAYIGTDEHLMADQPAPQTMDETRPIACAVRAGPISTVVRSGRCVEAPRLRLQRSLIAEC